jgi:hypothetical protein
MAHNRLPRNCRFTTHCAIVTAGGFHVPSPGGKIEGSGGSFGQYKRITR